MKTIFRACKIAILFLLIQFISCKENAKTINNVIQEVEVSTQKTKLKAEDFQIQIDGRKTNFYVLTNKNGIEVTFTDYGQRLISIIVPDKNGNFEDIVLGFNTLKKYISARENYMGSFIGRYANRIAKGKFSIKGRQYNLSTNNGENHLHGGHKGFNNVVWDVHKLKGNEIEFVRTSPDGEEGYPGNLKVTVN